jgi:hypothetical protein
MSGNFTATKRLPAAAGILSRSRRRHSYSMCTDRPSRCAYAFVVTSSTSIAARCFRQNSSTLLTTTPAQVSMVAVSAAQPLAARLRFMERLQFAIKSCGQAPDSAPAPDPR